MRPSDIEYDTVYDMTFPTGKTVRCRRIYKAQQLSPESLFFKCFEQFDLVDAGVYTDVFYFPEFVCDMIEIKEVQGDVQQYLDKGVEMILSEKGEARNAEFVRRIQENG